MSVVQLNIFGQVIISIVVSWLSTFSTTENKRCENAKISMSENFILFVHILAEDIKPCRVSTDIESIPSMMPIMLAFRYHSILKFNFILPLIHPVPIAAQIL